MMVGLGIDSDVPIQFDFDSQALDSIRFSIFWLHSVNIVLIQKLLIFLKKINSKHQFTNCELIKRN